MSLSTKKVMLASLLVAATAATATTTTTAAESAQMISQGSVYGFVKNGLAKFEDTCYLIKNGRFLPGPHDLGFVYDPDGMVPPNYEMLYGELPEAVNQVCDLNGG